MDHCFHEVESQLPTPSQCLEIEMMENYANTFLVNDFKFDQNKGSEASNRSSWLIDKNATCYPSQSCSTSIVNVTQVAITETIKQQYNLVAATHLTIGY